MIRPTNWLAKVVGLNGTSYLMEYIQFSNDLLRYVDKPTNETFVLYGLDTSLRTLDSGVC